MATKKLTYSEAMAEIESILARLRSGELSIDELTSSVARATKLISECRKMLATAEQEVEKLING
jgi:exodeoxyribonuclease VII small subunit